MAREFVYDQPGTRVVFGPGAFDRLTDEVRRLGCRRALVLSTRGHRAEAEQAAAHLGTLAAGVCAKAVMHVPVESVRAALQEAGQLDADCYVAVGGGSTIGLAKAMALETGRPIVAVPTTYSGSEMTAIYGVTEGGVKKTGRDAKVRPKTVLYDPALSVSLPAGIAAPSGMNAMAHCVEALYAPDTNPVMTLLAAEGLRVMHRSLPVVVAEPASLAARADALYGAWLAGMALGGTTMGLHHKLCHVLGGTFNLPHAGVHAVVLPHAAAYNRQAASQALRTAAAALGVQDAAGALYDLGVRIGAPTSLESIGMPLDGLDRAARLATESQYPNPRPVQYDGVRRLLENAYRGNRPESQASGPARPGET